MNNPLSMIDPRGYSFKSFLHKIGHFFKSIIKPAVAIAAAIVAVVLFGPEVVGFWTFVANAAIAGGTYSAAMALQNGGSLGDVLQAGINGAVAAGMSAALTYGLGQLTLKLQPSNIDFGWKKSLSLALDSGEAEVNSALTGIRDAFIAGIKAAKNAWQISNHAGEDAAQYWADRAVTTNNSMYNVPGLFASLWTEKTAVDTTLTLAGGGLTARWAARPFWKYISDLTVDGSGPWLTRGWGWRPPFGRDFARAKELLQLPRLPTDVVEVQAPWYRPVIGPRPVVLHPEWGSGGGFEYFRGWFFPE